MSCWRLARRGGHGPDDGDRERLGPRAGAAGGNQQLGRALRQRRGHDGLDQRRQRLRLLVRERLGHVGARVPGRRGDDGGSGPVVGGAREDVELCLAFRGRIRRTRPFVHCERLAPHRPRDLLQARARRVVLPGEAPRLHLHVRVRAGLHRPDEAVEVGAVERRHLEALRLLVLDAIDAAEAVVPIGTHGGVGWPVLRPARVVVDHRLVVEIDDVERPVGPDTRLDGPEPEIAAADELRLFAPLLLARRVAHAIRLHELVMHQVDGRLGREVAVAPPIGPGAPVVDGAAGRRRELSDQIDLGVGLFLHVVAG